MAGEFSPSSSGGINFSYLDEKIGSALSTAESELQAKIDGLGPNPTQKALLDMQVGLQKWTMFVQLLSTINKELADALKGIIQKAA